MELEQAQQHFCNELQQLQDSQLDLIIQQVHDHRQQAGSDLHTLDHHFIDMVRDIQRIRTEQPPLTIEGERLNRMADFVIDGMPVYIHKDIPTRDDKKSRRLMDQFAKMPHKRFMVVTSLHHVVACVADAYELDPSAFKHDTLVYSFEKIHLAGVPLLSVTTSFEYSQPGEHARGSFHKWFGLYDQSVKCLTIGMAKNDLGERLLELYSLKRNPYWEAESQFINDDELALLNSLHQTAKQKLDGFRDNDSYWASHEHLTIRINTWPISVQQDPEAWPLYNLPAFNPADIGFCETAVLPGTHV